MSTQQKQLLQNLQQTQKVIRIFWKKQTKENLQETSGPNDSH